MTKQQLFHEVMQLDPDERAEFIEDVRQAIEPGEFTDEQIAEFRRRAGAVESGQMETHDGEQVMRELFERLTRAKAG